MAFAAATRAAAGDFPLSMILTNVAMALSDCARASSVRVAITFGLPLGLPDCPFLNAMALIYVVSNECMRIETQNAPLGSGAQIITLRLLPFRIDLSSINIATSKSPAMFSTARLVIVPVRDDF